MSEHSRVNRMHSVNMCKSSSCKLFEKQWLQARMHSITLVNVSSTDVRSIKNSPLYEKVYLTLPVQKGVESHHANKKATPHSRCDKLMEHRGLEPLTSTLPA